MLDNIYACVPAGTNLTETYEVQGDTGDGLYRWLKVHCQVWTPAHHAEVIAAGGQVFDNLWAYAVWLNEHTPEEGAE